VFNVRLSRATAAHVTRTPALVADGDDNLVLTIIKRGQMRARQRDREVFLDHGGAYLWSNASMGDCINPTEMDLITLASPRRALASSVMDLDRAAMTLIPQATESLRLLISYVDMLQGDAAPTSSELLALSASHVHDLAVLALGATRDTAETARSGGVRAARLQAVKADIVANLTQRSLTVESLAARHGISARYVRSLFDSDHTTFSDFVREQRLRRAHRMLCSAAFAGHRIGVIAYDCGFGDLSYFNHCFRYRFGVTPSDVRAAATQSR
jgi:AraC-like DNA-binding protein